jgi:hypothetical protein
MSPDLTDLARRVVSSPHWRWMEACPFCGPGHETGIVVDTGFPDCHHGHVIYGVSTQAPGMGVQFPAGSPEWLPDFRTAAGIGCLRVLVMEAWAHVGIESWRPWVQVRRDHTGIFYVEYAEHDEAGALVWRPCCDGQPTEAAALVAALDAAPPPRDT